MIDLAILRESPDALREALARRQADIVARQLREAAMREPDPAVREKLWDEYRKYKGIAE